jgi:hypothetical protein
MERVPNGSGTAKYGLSLEKLALYPDDDGRILPTRLGNALRALETYGQDRFDFDSQQFWFELVGTADASVRQEAEEMRAQVDLFVAAVAAFSLLSAVSFVVAVVVGDVPSFVLSIAAAAFVPLAYVGAVRNMKDWQNSVRAMVNLGRLRVAENLGVVLPWKIDDEARMWRYVSGSLHHGRTDHRPWLDVFRRGTPFVDSDGVLRHPPSEESDP